MKTIKPRIYHKANKIDQRGRMSALCYAEPRAIPNTQRGTFAGEVNCLKCLALMTEEEKSAMGQVLPAPVSHEPKPCPNAANHTPQPEAYMVFEDWADTVSKTHHQSQCPDCELWVIWTPKTPDATLPKREDWVNPCLTGRF